MTDHATILTWNVNGILSSVGDINSIIERFKPLFMCFQETKTVHEKFPYFKDYICFTNPYIHPQHHGVAIYALESLSPVLVKPSVDLVGRFISVSVAGGSTNGAKVISSVYVKNSMSSDDERKEFDVLLWNEINAISNNPKTRSHYVAGDFNACLTNNDHFSGKAVDNRTAGRKLYEVETLRENLAKSKLYDLLDASKTGTDRWTFYTSRVSGPHDKGWRLDYIFGTNAFSKLSVFREYTSSDHVPLIAFVTK